MVVVGWAMFFAPLGLGLALLLRAAPYETLTTIGLVTWYAVAVWLMNRER